MTRALTLVCGLLLAAGASAIPDIWNMRVNVGFEDGTDGEFVVQVHSTWGPMGARRLFDILEANLWEGSAFHRVLPNDVAQWGIPAHAATAQKWATRFFRCDKHMPNVANRRGYVSFAKAGENTRTTQVFVNLVDNQHLDPLGYTGLGLISEGMDVVDRIYSGYGETVDQERLVKEGAQYAKDNFPKLSYVKTAVYEEFVPVNPNAPKQRKAKKDSASDNEL